MAPTAQVNWADATAPVSRHFSVKEAIWLPRWSRLATPEDGLTAEVKAALPGFLARMDVVREWFSLPVNVHCCFRPAAYNAIVGGKHHSAHMDGMAMDFDIEGMACSEAVHAILAHGLLDIWGMRMENNGLSPAWVHLDARVPGPSGRYFTP